MDWMCGVRVRVSTCVCISFQDMVLTFLSVRETMKEFSFTLHAFSVCVAEGMSESYYEQQSKREPPTRTQLTPTADCVRAGVPHRYRNANIILIRVSVVSSLHTCKHSHRDDAITHTSMHVCISNGQQD